MANPIRRIWELIRSYSTDASSIEAREAAYERAFGKFQQVHHSIDAKWPHVDLYPFPKSRRRDFDVLVTGGMSEAPMRVPRGSGFPRRVELILAAGAIEPWMITVLKILAETPNEENTFFGVHHTVPFGRTLGEGSLISAMMFIEPRILNEELSTLRINGKRIHFLQAVPITSRERKFAMAKSCARLEARLATHDCLIHRDTFRRSVV